MSSSLYTCIYYGYRIDEDEYDLCKLIYDKYIDHEKLLYKKDNDYYDEYYEKILNISINNGGIELNNGYSINWHSLCEYDYKEMYLIIKSNEITRNYYTSIEYDDNYISEDEKLKFFNIFNVKCKTYFISEIV